MILIVGLALVWFSVNVGLAVGSIYDLVTDRR